MSKATDELLALMALDKEYWITDPGDMAKSMKNTKLTPYYCVRIGLAHAIFKQDYVSANQWLNYAERFFCHYFDRPDEEENFQLITLAAQDYVRLFQETCGMTRSMHIVPVDRTAHG